MDECDDVESKAFARKAPHKAGNFLDGSVMWPVDGEAVVDKGSITNIPSFTRLLCGGKPSQRSSEYFSKAGEDVRLAAVVKDNLVTAESVL